MNLLMNRIEAYRVHLVPALLASVVLLFVWSVFRDLSDLSDRLGQLDRDVRSAPPSSGVSGAGPSRIAFDDLDTLTARWFGVARPEMIQISIPSQRQSMPPDESSAPPPSAAVLVPEVVFQEPLSMKLLGVFLGEQKKEALVEMSGRKQVIPLETEVNGWKLIAMERTSAVFESSSGQRETVRIFSDAPLDSKAP